MTEPPVDKWRHPVAAVLTLTATAFAEKVIEQGLRVVGPYGGYLYAAQETDDGYDMFRTAQCTRYFWSYRQVCTQDNVAGGHLVATVTAPSGAAFTPLGGYISASGNRAANVSLKNGDGVVMGYYSTVGAVASATATIAGAPGANTSSSVGQELHNKPVATPNYLNGEVTSAAQTETATLVLYAELIGTATAPTVSWAASGGTPNAATASENTVTAVVDCR